MQKRKLGKSNLEVSAREFDCIDGPPPDRKQAIAVIRAANKPKVWDGVFGK